MEEFTSAEGVTRLLRNKNTSPETAVAVARRLLGCEYSLYLPNQAMFVFDLICDRVSDFSGKNFMCWKFCPELWLLWAEVWHALGSEPLSREIRTKSFRKVKLMLVAIAVIDDASSKIEPEQPLAPESDSLLRNLFQCLNIFLTSGYIEVEEFSAMGLLKSYSFLLLGMDLITISAFPIDEWSMLLNRIYQLPHQVVTYKPSKKSMAKYFKEVLPVHLTLFGHRKNSLPLDTYEILHKIFLSVLFELERTVLPAQVASAMESPPDFLDERGVLFLFQEVIVNLASTDIAACEAIYVKLTAGKFFSMAESLITVLSNVNKTLSSTFFSEIYAKELAQPLPNWTLLSRLLQLDPDLTASKWKEVVSRSAKEPKPSLMVIAENIALGFVRARDFPLFASEVYPFALTVSDYWSSPEILQKLTPKVNEMSGNQIAKLNQQFLESKSLKPLSLLVQGLLSCPLAKQKASQALFADYSFCHAGWSEIAYYLLCIYGESLLETLPEICKRTLGQKLIPASKTDFDLLFRIAELTGDVTHVDTKQVLQYIKSMTKDSIIPFAERWIVIMGLFPGSYTEWFKKAFKKLEAQSVLNYIQRRQYILCELPLFLSELLVYIQESKPPCVYDLMSIFPPMVVRRFFGKLLSQMVADALEHPKKTIIRSTLKHIFQEPALNTHLEKDFEELHKFVSKTTEDTLPDTIAIAERIWLAHITTIKSPQSKAFVENGAKKLRESLKNPLNADLLLSSVILSMESAKELENFESFLEKYVAIICKRIKMGNMEQQLSALNRISTLTQSASAEIKKAIRKIESAKVSAKCQAQLFSLIAKISNAEDAHFIAALYLALRQSLSKNVIYATLREHLNASLKSFVKTLPDDVYTDIFASTITSLRDSQTEYVPLLVDLGSILTLCLCKDSEFNHAKLLVAFILAFTERKADLDDPVTILLFVNTITDSLSEKTWVFKQYTVELVLSTAHSLSHELDYGAASEKVYNSVVKLVSFVVLFHRHRFSSRYHLIVKVVADMMMPISNTGVLRSSSASAAAYARLLTSLCEPPSHVNTKESDSLTSRTAIFRKALRKHAHILLVNYIHTRLNHRFSGNVNDQMMPGIYSLFSLLSKTELLLVNLCLDNLGRAYYQSIYSTYKDHGKWRE
ncbi:hypothetical protein METBIDRAFT_31523 [Metschnikowia bicuspidata var. bicuspidata NRRL YB-4993]|uniref:Nucleolar 27S pre-rRNA processing Urb2/Npa2 C-terminal domain-containing protein n=1 Tax=Metschnikowia bicuspidata var. bicuspidata NRRL YB-4993 TaxID=869754 RepID=A0A1A0H9Q0_9ASCO|nr:hypothetical protein METBIDRAFT_31523 [Metschnikowia bicuspidata var. bicuspidata NRRL YB-4993]OBA20854.1 hypothetical protein METBIDRAFT_31523 [Metschnikowia bicuspidata var. bicuspidata NRRL YB-4993]